ncbi:hypothetical protein [Streptomyces sp. NPDC001410]|uniref:hypothetical protein n=1 Tax=Streptomyces sp. NPDC001410 TaxID=3364574 RepID=UPI0036AA8FE5
MANNQGRRRRFGSVRQLKSGRWQARYRDPNMGQLRSTEETYATKTDAEVALSLIESDITPGQWSDEQLSFLKGRVLSTVVFLLVVGGIGQR